MRPAGMLSQRVLEHLLHSVRETLQAGRSLSQRAGFSLVMADCVEASILRK
jgi:hypothetical protein